MSRGPVLLTGFGPFGGVTLNPSQLVVEAVEALSPGGVVTAVLPTSYARSGDQLRELVDVHRPDVVLLLGLDELAERLQLELVALNLDDAGAPDVDGETRLRRPIVRDGPVGYWTALDLNAMARTARQLGEDVAFSHDAGGYVCNHAFFVTAHLAATSAPGMRAGIVHLPPAAGDEPRLSRIVGVVRAWLDELEG